MNHYLDTAISGWLHKSCDGSQPVSSLLIICKLAVTGKKVSWYLRRHWAGQFSKNIIQHHPRHQAMHVLNLCINNNNNNNNNKRTCIMTGGLM
jgi:hypothetical protein